MSDKRVIDFNELKNRVNEKDIDKFEEYMYDLLYKTQTGQMTLGDFSANLSKYMAENNISQKKLFEIQKKVMERYGFDLDSVDLDSDYEMLRKKASFQEKYNKKVVTKPVDEYFIENANNKVKIILDKEKVVLISEGNIDLNDNELNEFLCSYKKMVDGDVLKITICKNSNVYDY